MFEIGVRWNDQSTVTANALPKLYTLGSTRTLEPNPDSKIHVRINLSISLCLHENTTLPKLERPCIDTKGQFHMDRSWWVQVDLHKSKTQSQSYSTD
jgi:hypothetical protein